MPTIHRSGYTEQGLQPQPHLKINRLNAPTEAPGFYQAKVEKHRKRKSEA